MQVNAKGFFSTVTQMNSDEVCDYNVQVFYGIFCFIVWYQLVQSSELVIQQISVAIQKVIEPESTWRVL